MRGSANSNTTETLLKRVTSPGDRNVNKPYHDGGLSHKFEYILKKCVNVNGSPLYETYIYIYLLAVLTNWEIPSSVSHYLVSEQYYWTSRVASDTYVSRSTAYLLWWNTYTDRHVSYVTQILFSQLSCMQPSSKSIKTGNDVHCVGLWIQTLFWIIIIFIFFYLTLVNL